MSLIFLRGEIFKDQFKVLGKPSYRIRIGWGEKQRQGNARSDLNILNLVPGKATLRLDANNNNNRASRQRTKKAV